MSLASHSRLYAALLGGAAVAAGVFAFIADDGSLGFAAAIVGLYALHIFSMRYMRDQWETLRGLERLVGELGYSQEEIREAGRGGEPAGAATGARGRPGPGSATEAGGEAPRRESDTRTVSRKFALGTVALIEGKMNPAEVSRTLAEQRKKPQLTFGDHAVSLGYLTETELEDLVQAQHDGVFTADQIQEARRRLQQYRRSLDPETAGAG